jgi:hypothetical protein
MGALDVIARPELGNAEGDAGIGCGVVALSPQRHRLQPHQSKRRVLAPLVGVATAGIDQVAAPEQQLLKVFEPPVGDQDRSLTHGAGFFLPAPLDTQS